MFAPLTAALLRADHPRDPPRPAVAREAPPPESLDLPMILQSLERTIAVFIVAIGFAAIGRGDEPAGSFRLMSFNIRYDNPRDGADAWPQRRDRVAATVEEDCDVAGLQEVLDRQLRDLKMRLPGFAVYGVGRDDGAKRGEYAPIFYRKSRFTLRDQGTFWLSKTPERPGSRDWDAAITRICSWVVLVDKQTKNEFFVFNTHFDHRGAVAREESGKLIALQVAKIASGAPALLTGDFNCQPDDKPYAAITSKEAPQRLYDSRLISSTQPAGPNSTWNGFRSVQPGRRIDFVFTDNRFEILSHGVLVQNENGRFTSDHMPVVVRVRENPDEVVPRKH